MNEEREEGMKEWHERKEEERGTERKREEWDEQKKESRKKS